MFLKQPELTSGSRPVLLHDETLLFVQNDVGLYEGKLKIADCQNGHAYLTSHRACYVDDLDPRKNSLAVDLREVERHEYQAGFLRSSPKITLHPKQQRKGFGSQRLSTPRVASDLQRVQTSSSSPVSRSASPFRQSPVPVAPPASIGNWICPICSFTNPVPVNFDRNAASEASLLPCMTCGIKPPLQVVLKAAIAANISRPISSQPLFNNSAVSDSGTNAVRRDTQPSGVLICPRCTFHNHPSLTACEICGASLPSAGGTEGREETSRSASPALGVAQLNLNDSEDLTSIKFSFRNGGDKVFYDRLKNAMIQRKWLAASAPPVPTPLDHLRNTSGNTDFSDATASGPIRPKSTGVGIAGLEQRGLQSRKNNEAVIGTAFEDLEALMASAKEIVALAQKFSAESMGGSGDNGLDSVLSESANAIGMIATKDMVSNSSQALYLSELARNLAEYVTDERRGILRQQGGTMSLVDLWAIFNRNRNGIELVSPTDFHKAAELWSSLGLPVRLRRFKSGLLVVQRKDWNDDKTIAQLKSWLLSLQRSPPEASDWNWDKFGCGVTAQDATSRFGWSHGVATEELEMAEERGVLCRDDGIEGLKFWLNYFIS